ncbi:hypothetical protein [Methylobacterium brachiatum]|uniref:hypothetical protein n=1 Tax=Methylobacterium brachiatum TaxID=269660 RepID=UPI0013CF0FBA|nr:hypothetical protein [Methylobacterium brachiatum]
MNAIVLRRGEPRFNMVGQRLPDSLHDTDEVITPGLIARLHRFALKALTDAGFAVSDWACEVYTMDADQRPADRYYTVEFTNPLGGMLGVQGIATQHGHPCLDHGVCVDWGRTTPEHRAALTTGAAR